LALEQEDGETFEDVKWLWLKCETTSIAAVSFGGMGICPNEFCTNVNFLFYEITKKS
jgi:hypothetical protein